MMKSLRTPWRSEILSNRADSFFFRKSLKFCKRAEPQRKSYLMFLVGHPIIHGRFLCKLRSLQNYSDGARMLVDSYLNGKIQFVRCGEKKSSVGRMMSGVLQGSVLGPLLSVFYFNDVSKVIKFFRFHIYVDDLQNYHSSSVSDLQRCYDEINMDLQQIHEWTTAIILIHRCRADIPPPTLLIGANVVKVVPKVRYLRFVLNERLTATDQLRKVC
jgi:hypothetical protein